MTKIVGGSARGRMLQVPGQGTRPTSQRAREALFNTLRSHLDLAGARVLDLFAGSGAVGLEALSAGAAVAVLVEQNPAACAVIRANAANLKLPGARVVARSAQSYLATVTSPSEMLDVIFADPPYAMPAAELTQLMAAAVPLLAPDGLLVIERPAREGDLQLPGGVAPLKNRRYGEAMLWYGRREQNRSSSELV